LCATSSAKLLGHEAGQDDGGSFGDCCEEPEASERGAKENQGETPE
jgi:hypothetical protein